MIEPMSRFRIHLVNTAAQATDFVRLAAHPNLRREPGYLPHDHRGARVRARRFAVRYQCLWGVHTCENDRGTPGGGLVPWTAVFEALAEATGCVRLMLETYNTGPGGFGYSRGIFQNVCPDAEQFVRRGIAFLQDSLAEVSSASVESP